MLVHLVATLALVLVACLMLWAGFRRAGRPMPRYLLPMTAGAVAIGYGVYAEYTWGARTADALPDSFVVLQRVDERSALAPWTWLAPRVVRLSAIDAAAVRTHPEHPTLRLVEVYLLERFHPTRRVTQLVDCAERRRADVAAGDVFGADGLPSDPDWRTVGYDDALLRGACASAGAHRRSPGPATVVRGRGRGRGRPIASTARPTERTPPPDARSARRRPSRTVRSSV